MSGRSVCSCIVMVAVLALSACGAPPDSRVAADLRAVAGIGGNADKVEILVRSSTSDAGTVDSVRQSVLFDLVAHDDLLLVGPMAGPEPREMARDERLTGGRATLLYQRGDGPWQVTGLEIEQPPSPTAPARR